MELGEAISPKRLRNPFFKCMAPTLANFFILYFLQICFLIAAACYLKAVRKKKEKRKQEILETARSAKDSDTDNQIIKSKTLRSF